MSIRFAHESPFVLRMNIHSFCAYHESPFDLCMNLHSFCAWIYIRFAHESTFVLRMNLHSFCAWIYIRFAHIMNLHSFCAWISICSAHESTFVLRMNLHSFCPWSVLFVLRDALEDSYEISWRLWSNVNWKTNTRLKLSHVILIKIKLIHSFIRQIHAHFFRMKFV